VSRRPRCHDVGVAVDKISLTYRIVMVIAAPFVRWWGRLEVVGEQLLAVPGPLVLMANHDSAWDPLVIGVAARRHRQVRALAKSSLWKARPVAWVLDRMGQIPIDRGRGDVEALAVAIDALRAGACVGIFPEGTVSRGRPLRPLSGAGRLALAVPEARVLGASIVGSVDIVRFPKRPRIRVTVFEPAEGPAASTESALALTRRIMTEARAGAPFAVPGRAKKAAMFRSETSRES
jgi:1-acyl-sn-glycerol-3-phosphate acyltransferase